MKICMVHPHDIFSNSEPWTVRIKAIAREFYKKGHDVRLIYFPLGSHKLAKKFKLDGIEIIPLIRKMGPVTFIKNIIRLAKIVDWADMVHFQKCHHYASVPTLIASYLKGKPIHYDWDDWEEKIYYASTHRSFTSIFIGIFFNVLERLIPKVVDTVTVSSKGLEKLGLKFGVDKDRIFKAHVGADLEKFHPSVSGKRIRELHHLNNRPVILYLGQLHGGQYVELFIRAAKLVLDSSPNAIFIITGQGFKFRELKELATNLGAGEQIIFSGSVSHDLVPQYVAAADICVACFEENDVTKCKSPLKVVEYLASGKPIVASCVGEVRNMVGGVGILTEPGQIESLAEGIIKLIKNEKLRMEMGKRARERALAKYHWRATSESIFKAYTKAMYLNNKETLEILISANDLERGNIKVGGQNFDSSKINSKFAECEVYFSSAGKYELEIRYINCQQLNFKVYLDDKRIYPEKLANFNRDYWVTNEAGWLKQAKCDVNSGFHRLRFSFQDSFPYIDAIKFKMVDKKKFKKRKGGMAME